MKRLIIVRHAKAEDLYNGISDVDRRLTNKGKESAKKVCKLLINDNIVPNLLISSHAVRAFETAKNYAKEYKIKKSDILIKNTIYDSFNVKELKNILKDIDNKNDVVFIFGHNPDLSEVLMSLVDGFYDELPKAAAAIINFNVDSWLDIDREYAELVDIKYVKNKKKYNH